MIYQIISWILNLFFEDDDDKLKEIYDSYKSGELLSGELKAILIEKLSKFLENLEEKRSKADLSKFGL